MISEVLIKNGQKLIIRKVTKEDTAQVVEYMLSIGGESDNLIFGEGELKMTIEEEKNFIEDINILNMSFLFIKEKIAINIVNLKNSCYIYYFGIIIY